ncbi:beta-galactosidase [Opitutaceae bacterium EW11]|nr:beta-galactosidase [Opitutaceae bacterium EW11]
MRFRHRALVLLAVFLAFVLRLTASEEPASAGRERLSLDQGWWFHLGDIPFPVVKGHDPTYQSTKAGRAPGAASPDFDDTSWRQLDLPHDWVSEAPFDPEANVSQGYRPRGFAWYRRHFSLPESDRGRHLELQFDGVATHCTVWVNGILAARNWCGYTSFSIDMTAFARFGAEQNTIAVRVDANAMEGWWYEGGGIYRHTWLTKRDAVHIATDGVFAQPIRLPDGSWQIPVEATLGNSGQDSAEVAVEVALLDPEGNTVQRGTAQGTVAALEERVLKLALPVSSPRLWSTDDPVLYQVRTTISRGGAKVDETTTRCGFRTLRFDPQQGFFLNNRPLKLKGVCNHQDHAGVGVAVPDALWEFRLQKLKEMGANAYRCAHNPPSAEFLDACDRLGMLVMDENRLFNSSPEYLRQLEWLVRRDRNHPSVILWSVFNEEPMQATETGYEMVRRMAAAVKLLDTTRPVTAAMSSGFFTPINVSQAVDVMGFNYNQGDYDRFHAEHPTLPMTSSEDTSAYMTRGAYRSDAKSQVIDSYDTQAASWGATHRDAWKAVAERPFVAGTFIWTGFDYHGEPTPYTWPSVSSFFGCLDLCGFPKMAFYLHQAQWTDDRPILHLVPHWNWPGRAGEPIKVMALTNADEIALFLNGRAIGRKRVDRFTMPSWEVPYAPGRLEAVGFSHGKEVSRFSVETTGEPVALRLTPDRLSISGDGQDALPLTVEAVDAEGRSVPTANLPVEFELTGPGTIIGLGNGDPNSHEPEKGNRRSLFNGLAQVIVRSQRGGHGPLVLRARAPGLRDAESTVAVKQVSLPPAVPSAARVFALRQWQTSPAMKTRPSPLLAPADNDMNSWATGAAPRPQVLAGGHWLLTRARFQSTAAVRSSGGKVVFKNIVGRAEVWLDGKLAGEKAGFDPAPLEIPVPAGDLEHVLSVILDSQPGGAVGIDGVVTIER